MRSEVFRHESDIHLWILLFHWREGVDVVGASVAEHRRVVEARYAGRLLSFMVGMGGVRVSRLGLGQGQRTFNA